MTGELLLKTFIAMPPRGKGRHRTTKMGRSYPDPNTVKAEQLIQLKVGSEWGQAPLDEPLDVQVLAYFERPKSKSKKIVFHTSKPDVDNVMKLALDSLNGFLWRDDAVVTTGMCQKRYCDESQPQPGIWLIVRRA